MSQVTFQRCPHDKENPYVMINRDLIRDQSISPQCRWLIIYLLSNAEGFIIKIKQVINHLSGFQDCGKNRVYDFVNEAIEAGYIKREEILHKGLKRIKYFVSETPKFKKCLRHPGSRDAVERDPGTQDDKERTSSSYEEHYKNKECKECSPPAPPPPSEVSADASNLTDFFIQKIREKKEGFREPNKQKWSKEFDLMIKKDKRSPEKIRELIAWLVDESTQLPWNMSPEKLRNRFDQLEMQKENDFKRKVKSENLSYINYMKETFSDQTKGLSFDLNFVRNNFKAKELSLYMHPEAFRHAFKSLFGDDDV